VAAAMRPFTVSSAANYLYSGRQSLDEYCHYETFRPECWKNEVIVIQEAIYGRRQVGRCIEAENSELAEDPRYLGCHANVLGLLDTKCSGKKECELRIPDADLELATPCVKSLKMFLEVRYTCIEGACYQIDCCSVSRTLTSVLVILRNECDVFNFTVIENG